MTEDWSLRDEIFYAAHRWPVFGLFCLAGVLAGWLLALTLPSPYRATKELYVGINIYQADQDSNAAHFSGIQFYNADDYKNWQMANLNSLVYLDPILSQTHALLQEIDPYWETVSNAELAGMLHIYWRNAGKWRLVAEHPQPDRARQAVLQWETAVIDRVALAVEQSRQVMALNIQMQALAKQQAEVAAQTAKTKHPQQDLQENYAQLTQQYSHASQLSLGLSPDLNVERITDEPPQISQVRPLGMMMLTGASLGAILWLFYNLVRISRKLQR